MVERLAGNAAAQLTGPVALAVAVDVRVQPALEPAEVAAQSFPSRPVRLVLGNPPGGASDVIARILGQPLGERLGYNIVVEHRPGANGSRIV